mgnify:CR=1 FL=1
MVPVENQLAPGQASSSEQRRIQPATSRAVEVRDEDFDYVELEERREREPLRQRRYLDEPEPQRRYDNPRNNESRDDDAPRYGNSRYDDTPYEAVQSMDRDEPRPLPRRPAREPQREPIDVEPEVMDDPW